LEKEEGEGKRGITPSHTPFTLTKVQDPAPLPVY